MQLEVLMRIMATFEICYAVMIRFRLTSGGIFSRRASCGMNIAAQELDIGMVSKFHFLVTCGYLTCA